MHKFRADYIQYLNNFGNNLKLKFDAKFNSKRRL